MTGRARRGGHLLAERAGRLEGVALHLPLNTSSHLGEVTRLVNDIVAAGIGTRTSSSAT